MRERIILAPGAKGAELIKNMALFGASCINMKVMSAGELSRYVLMRSGVSISQEFLNTREECTLIAKAVKGETYFGRTTYSDIKEIQKAISRLRRLVPDGDEAAIIKDTLDKAIFSDKNNAIFRVYEKYMDLLSDANALDGVSLIRKAIDEGRALDAEIIWLKEFPLSPIEETLLLKVSGGSYTTLGISELYEGCDKAILVDSYKACYGCPNEVETIITDIYKNKKLDKCVVAVTDNRTYSQLFFDYALLYDIPVTFGCGIPIINSNPARLLVMYYHWITDGFYSGESLLRMLSSKAFNRSRLYEILPEASEDFSKSRFFDIIKGLRLTNDKNTNDKRIAAFKKAAEEKEKIYIPYLEAVANELILSEEEFIAKYAYIRRGSKTNAERLIQLLDMSASSAIFEELKIIKSAGIDQSTDDIILNVLRLSVCGQNSTEGALHVTDINSAASSLRENLYIAGLSANKFPGSPSESYLLLDDDLRQFGEKAMYLSSEGKINRKKDSLQTLIHLASNLNCNINISYSGLNVSELKKDNASSVIFELMREQSGGNLSAREMEDTIKSIEYFEPAISATREIGKAFNQGKTITQKSQSEPADITLNYWPDREWSPSAFNKYIQCPRRFMLDYLMGIQENDLEDPFETIPATAIGVLAHKLMEQLANSNITKENFLTMSGEYFDRYISVNPPLIEANVEGERREFLEMMEMAYETDPHCEVALKEEDIHCIHDSGVKLFGYPDRLEKQEDGSYLVVDFKTGREIKHVEDDIYTCLQVVIYSYLLEQKGYRVSGGEFRYLRLGESVSCKYDEDMKESLSQVMTKFKDDITQFTFNYDMTDLCDYCGFKGVCSN